MDYEDPTLDVEAEKVWTELLEQSNPSTESLLASLKMGEGKRERGRERERERKRERERERYTHPPHPGVPKKMRIRVWKKLILIHTPTDSSKDPLPPGINRSSYEQYRQETASPDYLSIITADIGE